MCESSRHLFLILTLFFAQDMTLLHTITHPARTHDILFVTHPHQPNTTVLLVAAENKKVGAYVISESDPASPDQPLPPPTIFAEFVGHENR
jgi:protein MAK11